jgi:hypothetical protein
MNIAILVLYDEFIIKEDFCLDISDGSLNSGDVGAKKTFLIGVL